MIITSFRNHLLKQANIMIGGGPTGGSASQDIMRDISLASGKQMGGLRMGTKKGEIVKFTNKQSSKDNKRRTIQ